MYAFPIIGGLPAADIDSGLVLEVLQQPALFSPPRWGAQWFFLELECSGNCKRPGSAGVPAGVSLKMRAGCPRSRQCRKVCNYTDTKIQGRTGAMSDITFTAVMRRMGARRPIRKAQRIDGRLGAVLRHGTDRHEKQCDSHAPGSVDNVLLTMHNTMHTICGKGNR